MTPSATPASPSRASTPTSWSSSPRAPRLSVDMDEGQRPRPDILREVNRAPVEADHKVVVLGQFHTMEQLRRGLPQDDRGAAASHDHRGRRRRAPARAGDHRLALRAHRLRSGARRRGGRAPGGRRRGARPGGRGRRAAAGDLARARLLATDPALAARRDAWRAVPERLTAPAPGSSSWSRTCARRIDAAQAPLDAQHGDELADLEERIERYGLRRGPRSPSWSPATSARSAPCAARSCASAWPRWPAATATPWPTHPEPAGSVDGLAAIQIGGRRPRPQPRRGAAPPRPAAEAPALPPVTAGVPEAGGPPAGVGRPVRWPAWPASPGPSTCRSSSSPSPRSRTPSRTRRRRCCRGS